MQPHAAPVDLALLPSAPGVYRFRDREGRALYVGRAVDLRRRVRSYWGSRKGRPRLHRLVPQIAHVEVAVCASEHEAAWLERNLLEMSRPRFNRARGGLEVPVHLVLDPSPRRPSLAVVAGAGEDDPASGARPGPIGTGSQTGSERADPAPAPPAGGACRFGPFLGATRVREAVLALDAVLPLASTADGLRGAAAELAALRGVGPADRVALADELTGVLRGDLDATRRVERALIDRRGAAAADLAFERAAEIQRGIDALAWLLAEQRVTARLDRRGVSRPELAAQRARLRRRPKDATTIAAWAGGVLVEFGRWDGQVRSWSQRRCTAAEAAPAVEATPAAWRAFAGPSAEAAARLLGAAAARPAGPG